MAVSMLLVMLVLPPVVGPLEESEPLGLTTAISMMAMAPGLEVAMRGLVVSASGFHAFVNMTLVHGVVIPVLEGRPVVTMHGPAVTMRGPVVTVSGLHVLVRHPVVVPDLVHHLLLDMVETLFDVGVAHDGNLFANLAAGQSALHSDGLLQMHPPGISATLGGLIHGTLGNERLLWNLVHGVDGFLIEGGVGHGNGNDGGEKQNSDGFHCFGVIWNEPHVLC